MPKFGKFALIALMTSAMAIPAHAETGIGANVSANVGGSATTSTDTSGSRTNAGANAGTGSTSVSRPSGTGITTSGSANTTIGTSAITESARPNPSNTGYSGTTGTVAGTATGAGTGADARGDSMTQYSREGFIGSDTDSSSSLNLEEYRSYLGNTGSRAQIQSQFNTLDTNGDGFLSEIELQASGSAAAGTQVR